MANWTSEYASTILTRAGEFGLEGAFMQNGWKITGRAVNEDGSGSFQAKREFVDFGAVLGDLWEYYTTEYEAKRPDSANDILEKIVALKTAATDYFNNFTVPDEPTSEGISFTSNAAFTNSAPTTSRNLSFTVGDITLSPVNVEKYTLDDAAYNQNIVALDSAFSSYKTKIDRLKTDLNKVLSDYELKLATPATTYNTQLNTLKDTIVAKFDEHNDSLSDLVKDWGQSMIDRVELAFKQDRETAQQGLVDRGLWNSGIWSSSVKPGIDRQEQLALNDADDKIIARKIEVETTLYSELRQIQERFVAIFESMRAHDLQAVSTIFSKITHATDTYIQFQAQHLDRLTSYYFEKRKMAVTVAQLENQYNLQKAQVELQLNMKAGDLDLQIQELELRAKISEKEISTKIDELIIRNNIAKFDGDVKLDQMELQAEVSKAEVAVKIDGIKAQLSGLELDKMKAQAQAELAIAGAYETALRLTPTLSDIANALGAAVSIEGAD